MSSGNSMAICIDVWEFMRESDDERSGTSVLQLPPALRGTCRRRPGCSFPPASRVTYPVTPFDYNPGHHAVQGEPTTFWGKLNRSGNNGPVSEWHPLFDHSADVAAVAEALLGLPVWRRRLIRLAGQDLSEVGWARLCVLAALHDLGKLNIGFQAKGRADLGQTAGHVTEALGALFKSVFSCLGDLSPWGDGVTGLLVAALCHHGRPFNINVLADTAWQTSWWTPRAGLDPRTGAEDLLRHCRTWFPKAFETDGPSLPETAVFSHAFAGLVMLADWVGSDTRFFPFSKEGGGDRMSFARSAARDAVAGMALDVALITRTDASRRDPFTRIAPVNYLPRPAQAAICALPLDAQHSITVLESETGSGKTEAVLARFVSLFEAGLVDGLYFALPTRSAATQMHQRVHAAVRQAFAAPPAVILAVPGYLRVDDVAGRRLPPFEVLWPDQDRFRYRAWAAENPKRYLAGCVVVGTVDQVLLSSLMVGHAHLRATALLRQLLVVDEVHASDAYMTTILEDVLARHKASGGHAILLSATLGGEARGRLISPGESSMPPALAEAEGTPYPLITHRGDASGDISVSYDRPTRVVRVEVEPWIEDSDALATAAFAAALQGAKVLVIKNTVKDCIAAQEAVERQADAHGRRDLLFGCDGIAAPHHARFARVDREALDLSLDQHIGAKRREGGCVVVATQTVQQSLDLDADVLFSDLSPADVLLQRIGRLHRHHDRSRPAGFEGARAFVIVPADRNLSVLISDSGLPRNHHGLGSVYPDLRILEATWRLIERHREWRIPAMSRHIVESTLHSSVLEAIAEGGGMRWQKHAVQMMGIERAQSRQADLNLVDWTKPYGETSFPSTLDQRIMTRLGEGDRRVRFEPPVMGPFRHMIGELLLRAPWVRGVPSDLELAENVVNAGGATCFMFGGTAFVYDRLGLRPGPTRTRRTEVSEDNGP